jgi:uncharacterized protein (DUF433 family)
MPEIAPRISVDSEVRFGRPVITGTRVSVDAILGHLAGGDSIETLIEEYGISRDDVLAALGYAAAVLRHEDVRATR